MTIEVVDASTSFFDRPNVEKDVIPVGEGIPFGIERVSNPVVGIGGVYGAWGKSYDNQVLPALVEERLGRKLSPKEKLSLADLGFVNRHHVPEMTDEENKEIEVEVGARLLREAAHVCGWDPADVDAVLIGVSAPISGDFLDRIAEKAGIMASALKVTIHKACDGSTSALHLALNPNLPENLQLSKNIAKMLDGKKVLVGGIEGLSRFINKSHDFYAWQLFGNAAGVIGIIPGKTIKFLVGQSREVYDLDGVLQVQMRYPHALQRREGELNVEVTQLSEHEIRVAGLMHEPEDGSSVVMAEPMGMVKLFVRTGVEIVRDVYQEYQQRLSEMGIVGKSFAVSICHHANYKINKLKEKHLQNGGIVLPMPWLLSEFGNVSAASNMIALLRELPELEPHDHVLIDGFGAGTYYDTIAVEMGKAS